MKFLSLLFLVFLFFAACSKLTMLEGSVFVVTNGAQNVKLGGIPVALVTKENVDLYFSKIKPEEFNPELMFDNFPSKEKTVTDAEGKFKMTITKPGQYYLMAQGSRQIFDQTENYYWLTPLDAAGGTKEIILTNSNIFNFDTFKNR